MRWTERHSSQGNAAMGHRIAFLRGWSRDPRAVGLPFASSYWTSKRLAQTALDAAIPGGGPVLELGAGTGPVTKALIDAGCPPDQIIVVEQDGDLCRMLERRLAGVRVLQGNALAMGDIRQRARVQSVSVVLSGLPMRIIAPDAAARCYTGAFELMPPGGSIIQYTYGFRSPVDADEMPELDATFVGRELRNVPPMGIWSYRQSGGFANGHAKSGEWIGSGESPDGQPVSQQSHVRAPMMQKESRRLDIRLWLGLGPKIEGNGCRR